jgi:hypothetical protein
MELKQVLQKKKEQLETEFEGSKKEAQFFMNGKQKLIKDIEILDTKLESLVGKGSLIAAKIEAINDMLKE